MAETPRNEALGREQFWKLIAEARTGAKNDEAFVSRLTQRLGTLGAEAILDFARQFQELRRESYRWSLWGAAYLIKGGCSDDCFDYFRAWLIGQGQKVYERALSNPDTLADLRSSAGELEPLLRVADRAYLAKTGKKIPESLYTAGGPVRAPDQQWVFDDNKEMKRRYPRLFARFR